MTVERILSDKGRAVVTVEPDRTLAEAARLLTEKRIGAVVVSDKSRPVIGILSERDIVRGIASHGAQILEEPVSRCMTTKVVTCVGHTGVLEVLELMTNGKFRHVPVVEDHQLVGIVSIGDIVKYRLAQAEAETRAMRDYIATA
ncbi:CBS domain-containing protein [Microvirga massiliensis]|uniref:CBS domain-containing protein n=1 Tax=Microvirga massiliensis TaxID=1033741 RepID=UPI00062B4AD8|nr:CBS domain-containing protein [Microvirga massiliensis]